MSKPTLERRGSLVHLQRDFHSHSVNENVIEMKYAVRGALVLHAGELKAQLAAGGDHGLPFDEVIFCNIGNPQQLEQPPITFLRQVRAPAPARFHPVFEIRFFGSGGSRRGVRRCRCWPVSCIRLCATPTTAAACWPPTRVRGRAP